TDVARDEASGLDHVLLTAVEEIVRLDVPAPAGPGQTVLLGHLREGGDAVAELLCHVGIALGLVDEYEVALLEAPGDIDVADQEVELARARKIGEVNAHSLE